ncbi:serine/threonine-protein kinase KIN2 [Puccinia graminis f. sp. tritici]|uniref:Serine/threonine-protein kinase KIN2 n=1 Tax=Puccinia graminis f. sp. tritici TaxID=56615 RepID=A0A5B0M7F4_PUCGR|nr:serine/threonine-protein kinase KIN2 [Puccinia graminis f. sp. tritici]
MVADNPPRISAIRWRIPASASGYPPAGAVSAADGCFSAQTWRISGYPKGYPVPREATPPGGIPSRREGFLPTRGTGWSAWLSRPTFLPAPRILNVLRQVLLDGLARYWDALHRKRLSPPFSPGGLQEQQQTAAQAQPDHVSDDIPTDAIPMSAPISGQSGPMAAFGAKSDLDANLSSRSRHHQRGSSAGGEAGHNDVPASEGEGKVVLKSSASGPNWRPRMSSTSWCTHPLVGRNPS